MIWMLKKNFKYNQNNYGLYLLFSASGRYPLLCIKNAIYPIGMEYMKNLFQYKKELGEKCFQENYAKINPAISTGLWNFKVLSKFVRFFLKNN